MEDASLMDWHLITKLVDTTISGEQEQQARRKSRSRPPYLKSAILMQGAQELARAAALAALEEAAAAKAGAATTASAAAASVAAASAAAASVSTAASAADAASESETDTDDNGDYPNYSDVSVGHIPTIKLKKGTKVWTGYKGSQWYQYAGAAAPNLWHRRRRRSRSSRRAGNAEHLEAVLNSNSPR